MRFLFLITLLYSNFLFAAEGQFDFLKQYEVMPLQWTQEVSFLRPANAPPVQGELAHFYEEFRKDGQVTMYLGWGYEAYNSGRADGLFSMLKALAEKRKLSIGDWQLSSSKTRISFKELSRGITYVIDLGHERNEFQAAFANHEIMMYHGHSRYGRGPAFDNFQNYYRMGAVWPNIEVTTTNPYFLEEAITLQETYPLQYVDISGSQYPFQYMGQKEYSSHLPSNSYTKNVEGMDKDLQETNFMSEKQIFWLYSCQNVNYWKESLREMFTDPSVKFIFGTKLDGYWGSSPAAVFIMSVVGEVSDSTVIVNDLNATGDCGSCFTTY